MSTREPDHNSLFRALEAILLSPDTARAVARTLMSQTAEREMRMMVSDVRAQRAQRAYEQDANARETAELHGAPISPWARSG